MSRRSLLVLFLLGLGVQLLVAHFQTIPGYLDADYYFMGGRQLAEGKGLTEPFIWNYLDDPAGIPHPSHAYWMPMASLVTALGMWITGQKTYAAGRLGFILLAALVPPLTATLAFRFSGRTALGWVSGLLAAFPVFHTPFLPVPDNYGIFMVAGGTYFLIARRERPWFWLGLLAGILSLARSDGLLWFALTYLLLYWRTRDEKSGPARAVQDGLLILAGFLLVMGPWYVRNLSAFGSIMGPSGSRALWLTSYDETFIYPASKLNMQSWLASGWQTILRVRFWALRTNIQTVIAAQGHIILFPFIVAGMWIQRRERIVQLGFIAWVILFAVMTVIFPFAGVRGSLFHAGAALQPLFWSLAPIGLDKIVSWVRSKGRFTPQAQTVFRIALVQSVILLSAWVVWVRVIQPGWQEGELQYPAVETFLVEHGIGEGEPVIVLSAPGYTMLTGRPALGQPFGDTQTLLAVAQRYNVHYFVFEARGRLKPLRDLYDHPQAYQEFDYLGEVDDARVFKIR
jgi:hypothetical protein